MYNKPLLRKVLEHIEAHPDEHDQLVYAQQTPCGTTACVAGHTVVIAGWDLTWERVGNAAVVADRCVRDGLSEWIPIAARNELGLNGGQAHYLFHFSRTVNEIREFVAELLEYED